MFRGVTVARSAQLKRMSHCVKLDELSARLPVMKFPASSGFLTYYVLHHGDEVAFLRDGKKGTVYAYSGKLKPMLSFD